MADAKTVVHLAENSPEHVAKELADQIIISIERKSWSQITRKEYLDTYAECLTAVRGFRQTDESAHAFS